MSKTKLSHFIKSVQKTLQKHSPEILTGMGIAGMISTVVLAVNATPKALKLIAEAEDAKFDNGHGDTALTKAETVKAAWKCYIPAAITCTLSAACIIGASSVNLKRNAALATAYQLSEKALTTYKEKVVETIGEEKERIIKDKVAEQQVKENPKTENKVFVTGDGDVLCYDSLSGQYFKSTLDRIHKAENEVNYRLLSENYISLNAFYDMVGIRNTSLGDDLGWNVDGGQLKIDISSQIAENGQPCLVLEYELSPKYDFWKMCY